MFVLIIVQIKDFLKNPSEFQQYLIDNIYCVCSIIVQNKDFLKNPSEFQQYLIDNIYCVCSIIIVQIKDFLKNPSEFQQYLIDNIYCVCSIIIVQIKDFLKNPSEFQQYLIDNIQLPEEVAQALVDGSLSFELVSCVTFLHHIPGIFLPFRNLDQGLVDFGKKKHMGYQNWGN